MSKLYQHSATKKEMLNKFKVKTKVFAERNINGRLQLLIMKQIQHNSMMNITRVTL